MVLEPPPRANTHKGVLKSKILKYNARRFFFREGFLPYTPCLRLCARQQIWWLASRFILQQFRRT